MVSISAQLEKLRGHVDRVEDILDGAKSVPFSNRVSIDRDEINEVLDHIVVMVDEMCENLPTEIQHAKRIIADNDKIVADARSKASMIIANANDQIAKLTDDHEITKRATEQATEIVDDGKRNAREMRINAMEYADEILEKSEGTLREAVDMLSKRYNSVLAAFSETADLLYSNRQELRGKKE